MDTLTLRELIYRYFFFGWLFRNADHGNLWERNAAWIHNKSQSRWLPTYMRRWVILALVLFAFAAWSEAWHAHYLVFTALYVSSALTVPFITVCCAAWMLFQAWD